MLIRATSLTTALARWLRESHDDGTPELVVRYQLRGRACVCDIRVLRANGSDLSEAERLEITARLAAHAVEPLK